MKRRLSGFLALLVCLAAAQAGKGAGDSPATALALGSGSTTVVDVIERDLVHDWYSITIPPGAECAILARTNTLWDTVLAVYGPDGRYLMARTNSILSAGVSDWRWTNMGPALSAFIEVYGFLDFTTGRYELVVQSSTGPDADQDGLPDAWEQRWFQGTHYGGVDDPDQDGMLNAAEYAAGTVPTNPASALIITLLDTTAGVARVGWPIIPHGYYAVQSRSGLISTDSWTQRAAVFSTSEWTGVWAEPLTATQRFYRVRLLP